MSDQPWYRTDPAALEAAVEEALVAQPLMRLDDEGDRIVFRGRFDVRDERTVIEAFAIDVDLSPLSPRDLPTVWETGGRIPRVLDPHHVVPPKNFLCVTLPDAYWYYFPQGLSLTGFLNGPLRDHLAGQAVVLQGRPWPADEWSHGLDGAIEFYREVLGVTDDAVLFNLMLSELSNGSKRQMICGCGSGKKRRHCHGKKLHALRKGPSFVDVCCAVRPGASEAGGAE